MTWTCPKEERGIPVGREEEEIDAQVCPCGKATESRTHIVGECEMYKEERYVFQEEMREIDECYMEEFDPLDNRDKTIAILDYIDRGRRRRSRKRGHKW